MHIEENLSKREFETVLPLVNVVFLLLIFFMLSGAFTKHGGLEIINPEADFNNEADLEKITIIMSKNNEFAIEKEIYSKDQLLDQMQILIDRDEISVQLRADKNVKSQDLIGLMDSLGGVGLSSIDLITVIPVE